MLKCMNINLWKKKIRKNRCEYHCNLYFGAMKLYLLRHGDALIRSETGRDFDRKLSPQGIEQAKWISDQLNIIIPNTSISFFCSAAKRTRETAHYALSSLKGKVQFFDELYHASYLQILSFLQSQTPMEDYLLLIGHNNGISDLATYLIGERIVLPTCGLVCITFPDVDAISKGMGAKEAIFFAPNEIS